MHRKTDFGRPSTCSLAGQSIGVSFSNQLLPHIQSHIPTALSPYSTRLITTVVEALFPCPPPSTG